MLSPSDTTRIDTRKAKFKEATRLLESTLSRRRVAMECAEAGAWHWDIVTGELAWDDNMFQVFGCDREEWSSDYNGFYNCLYPDDRERVQQAVQACIDHDDEYFYQFRVVDSDGKIRHIIGRGGVSRDPDGKPLVMAGICLRVPPLLVGVPDLPKVPDGHSDEQ